MHCPIEDICGQVIEFDNCIRFAGFATNAGKIIACKYRKDVIPLLTLDETQLSFIDSSLMMKREAREPKLGKVICSIVLYEKLTYATILVNSEDYPILKVSIDKTNKRVDHEILILYEFFRYFPITLKRCKSSLISNAHDAHVMLMLTSFRFPSAEQVSSKMFFFYRLLAPNNI